MDESVLTATIADEESLHSQPQNDTTDLLTARGTPKSATMEVEYRERDVQGHEYDDKDTKPKCTMALV
ncbi:hypothetical protein KIN20_017779 [Parelaphostrongylus tenuis]|uniref:Uncharacterized protein n=1 Tax=Parelaphostrongylus tenuis TaxID=148309 RepID=A0AAD5QNU8_PARTN|nr:hypothetical protein KIN20_017779 [Parelaphostrongylus tenuis]